MLDAMDDIHALQDPYTEQEVLMDMLQDDKLHELLHVRLILNGINQQYAYFTCLVYFLYLSSLIVSATRSSRQLEHHLEMQCCAAVTQWKQFQVQPPVERWAHHAKNTSARRKENCCIYCRCRMFR